MKTMFNLTTSSGDLDRFTDKNDLLHMMDGFDGVELMHFEDDVRGVIPKGRVIGYHTNFFYYWIDFFLGNNDALLHEFCSMEQCYKFYGGKTRDILVNRIKSEVELAKRYNAEYVVFHAADCAPTEFFSQSFSHSDELVIDAVCDMINEAFAEEDSIMLLLENLLVPGMRFTNPGMTQRIMDGIHYANKGILLDTGHLMHTDSSLRTQEEGVEYINKQLDKHGDLVKYIKGIHLNKSLTGEYYEEIKKSPPELSSEYQEREFQIFTHIFKLDLHKPFTGKGVKELIQRINPDYLTFEFITMDKEEHIAYLREQQDALK